MAEFPFLYPHRPKRFFSPTSSPVDDGSFSFSRWVRVGLCCLAESECDSEFCFCMAGDDCLNDCVFELMSGAECDVDSVDVVGIEGGVVERGGAVYGREDVDEERASLALAGGGRQGS